MSVMETNMTRELQDIRNDLTLLRKDLSELAQAMQVNLKEETSHLRENTRQVFETARERSGKMIHEVEHRIEERPFFSVLAAFGVGIMAGLLAERRMLPGR